jgi:hypothetical protein
MARDMLPFLCNRHFGHEGWPESTGEGTMRNKLLLLALTVVLLPATLAGAGTLDQLTATADCNAWSSEATITFRVGATQVLLVYSMQLADSTGVEIERYDYEQYLTIPSTPTVVYPFGAAWSTPLQQPATMTVTADVYDMRGGSFGVTGNQISVALACAPPPDGDGSGGDTPADVCRHATRWWLRHVPQWPVTSLTLGGTDYDAASLERLLRSPHRGMVTRRLAHQLAVAKLNLANGVVDDISAEVAAADAWLTANPVEVRGHHREPGQAARREALRLVKALCHWNHGGCPDGAALAGAGGKDEQDGEGADKSGLAVDSGATGAEFTGDLADYVTTDKAAEETTSLGALKAMFR